jgi:ssDNA-binding Zn-finger/Zn-ribbon topoisomerase 1
MKVCPSCSTVLIVKDYDPENHHYAPANYCPNCDVTFEAFCTDEDYKTPQTWRKVLKWGLIITGVSLALKLIF